MVLNHVRSTLARGALLGATVMVALLALAAPASAQAVTEPDTQVVLTGRVEVRAGERTESVVIFDGPAVIAGDVEGGVVAMNGDIQVSGTVSEDVVALRGRATILSGARVGGDVVSSKAPDVQAGATVEGDTKTVRFSLRGLGALFWLAWWVAVTVSLLILGLILLGLFPATMAAAYAVARGEPGRAIGFGLLVAIGLPIVSILVMVTLVGIPLGLVGLLSLALLYALGHVVAALAVGRMMIKEPKSRFLAFLVGLVVLRILGLIPFVGGLVTFVAAAYGVGALAIAGWRAARRPTPTETTTVGPGASPLAG